MSMPEVVRATSSDHAAVRATVTLAFAADPVNRWYLRDAASYLKYFPKVVDVFLTPSIESGGCFMTKDRTGAALWFPPGVTADEETANAIFGDACPPDLQDEFGAFMAGIESFHPHDEDCWYLPIVGVDPAYQGTGIGGAIMKAANAHIDENGDLSYLEASSESNAALYARHGFEVLGEVQIGSSPVARPMLRQRQTR